MHGSSASDESDPYPGSDHVGGRDAEGGQIYVGGVFVAHLARWEEFFLDGNTWPSFLFPVLVGMTRGKNSSKYFFARYVTFATHGKFGAC